MKHLFFIFMFIFVQSCATIFSDNSVEVTLNSEPEGASVYFEGQKIGTTPFTYTFDRDTFVTYRIRMSKEGYKSEYFRIRKTLNTVSILNLTSVFSWATDALSGNMMEYRPRHYLIELQKKGVSSHSDQYHGIKSFVWSNQANILSDIARGEGDYLDSYLALTELPIMKWNVAKDNLRSDFENLRTLSEKDFLEELNSIVAKLNMIAPQS